MARGRGRATEVGGAADPPSPLLRLPGRRVTLRAVTAGDLPSLRRIVYEPGVARWWGTAADDEFCLEDAVAFTIAARTDAAGSPEVVGLIQYEEVTDPSYFSAGVDLFVSTRMQGRGIGTDALRTLIAWLIDERGHHRLTVDPALVNQRAIAVYERLGFRPVGVLRRYERDGAGVWRDGLLMELLADEFVR